MSPDLVGQLGQPLLTPTRPARPASPPFVVAAPIHPKAPKKSMAKDPQPRDELGR